MSHSNTQPDEDLSDLGIEGYESAIGWEPAYQYQKLLDDYKKKHPFINPTDNMLELRPANEWLADTEGEPTATPLFGDFWKEGELTIMFADTGTGKSILAIQIAEAIARGKATIDNGKWTMENSGNSQFSIFNSQLPPQRVLYLDFELTTAQFAERYSSTHNEKCTMHKSEHCALCTVHYEFAPNLLRTEIDWQGELPAAFKTMAQFMEHSIRQHLVETDAKVLIVDNISYLHTANTSANAALYLMKALRDIKRSFGISILVLAHTPKRPFLRPLTVNDLAGSKMLANFADNLFAIGTSTRANNIRYLKQIKPRMSAYQYDASNVIVCRIEKTAGFNSPPYEGGVAAAAADGVVLSSLTPHSPPNEGGVAPAAGDEVVGADDGVVLSSNSHISILNSQSTAKPFLGFTFIEFANERHHTTRPHRFGPGGAANALNGQDEPTDRAKLIAAAKHLSQKGHTQREIAEILNIGKGTVGRYLSEGNDS
jgi:hypothetical protein